MAGDIDELLTKIKTLGTEKPLTLPEKILGYSRSYLAGPTFNYADELEANLASLFSGKSSSDELKQIQVEQDRFKKNTDYLDNVVEIGSGIVLNPLGALGKTAQGAKGGLTTLTRLLTNPVSQGAIAGMGAARPGEDLVTAGLWGGGIGAAGAAVASGVGSLAQGAAKEADRLKLSSFGVNFGAIAKQLKKLDGEDFDEIPLLKTVDKFEKAGVINAGNDAIENFSSVIAKQKSLGEDLGTILKNADRVVPKNTNFKLDASEKYIESLSGKAKDLANEAMTDEYIALTTQMKNGGSLLDLQKAKIGLNYKFDQNPYRENIIKSMRSDLRKEIETRVDKAAKTGLIDLGLNGSIKKINQNWGEAAELKDVFTRQLAKDYGGDVVEDVFNSIRTSGGIGTALNSKNPLAIAMGLIGTAARTNENKGKIADTLREFQRPIGAFGDFLEGDKIQLPGQNKILSDVFTNKLPAPITSRTTNSIYDIYREKPNMSEQKFDDSKSLKNNLSSVEDLMAKIKKHSTSSESNIKSSPNVKKQDVSHIESKIDADPYLSTLYEVESGRNPLAKNPESSASGGFQFIKATAKALGVTNPFDLEQSFEGIKKLTNEFKSKFGNDPLTLYSAHYLGEPVLKKYLAGKELNETEQAQVNYLKRKVLPRFKAIYEQKIKEQADKSKADKPILV